MNNKIKNTKGTLGTLGELDLGKDPTDTLEGILYEYGVKSEWSRSWITSTLVVGDVICEIDIGRYGAALQGIQNQPSKDSFFRPTIYNLYLVNLRNRKVKLINNYVNDDQEKRPKIKGLEYENDKVTIKYQIGEEEFEEKHEL
jgi:hypothetical protein